MHAPDHPMRALSPSRLFILSCLALSLLVIGPNEANAQASARDMVEGAATQAIEALQERRSELEQDPGEIYNFVHEYLLPHFDFEYSSRLVLGRHWRQASPDERERFREAFQQTLIRSYASSMLQYSDQAITYLPHREPPDATETTVKTEIEIDSGKPVAVDYVLRRPDPDAEWKVFDVIIDGISVVVNYRSTFASEIRRLNGLAPLIERLEDRNRRGVPEPAVGLEGGAADE